MLTANDLDTVHALYHPAPALDTKYPCVPDTHTPNDGVNFLTSDDYDQISGILSDYCAMQSQHIQALTGICQSSIGADGKRTTDYSWTAKAGVDLCQKWLERAADLRDRIEAR